MKKNKILNLRCLSALTAGGLICLATWFAADRYRWAELDRMVRARAQLEALRLKHDFDLRIQAGRRMVEQLEPPHRVTFSGFDRVATDYFRQFPNTRAMAQLDADFNVLLALPSVHTSALGQNLADLSEARRQVLELARDAQAPALSEPIDLADDSGRGMLLVLPKSIDGIFTGALVLAYQADLWLTRLLIAAQDTGYGQEFSTRVEMNGEVLGESRDFVGNERRPPQAASVEILNQTFTILLRPRADFITGNRSWMPEIATALMVLAIVIIFVSFQLATRARSAEKVALHTNSSLRQINELLREEVEERRSAENAATRARRATSQFLATMSHEIRTPLNAIMGMFQLIEMADEVPDRQKRQAATGLNAAERLFRDLTHVIDSSRLDAGALQVQPTPVPTKNLMISLEGCLLGLIQRSAKPLTGSFDIDSTLPSQLLLDQVRVVQIVMNLMDNAVKFSDEGTIAMRVKWSVEDGGRLSIEVHDSGPGIPVEKRERVFERFYQVKDGVDRPYQGSGLGLSISHELAQLMGGRLTVFSSAVAEKTKGACFILVLPGVSIPKRRARRQIRMV